MFRLSNTQAALIGYYYGASVGPELSNPNKHFPQRSLFDAEALAGLKFLLVCQDRRGDLVYQDREGNCVHKASPDCF